MTDYVQKKIAPGVELLAVPAERFKTNELAIHLAVPMEEQMAANYALAVSAVSRKGKAYPDMRTLHLQLDKLYGAAISVTANKSGGCQILKMGITTLDDRFALDDEKIAEAGLELLMNLLFDPLLGEDGLFSPADIETERRVLLEKLAAEENEKRLYAVMQMQQIMFAGDPYRINPKGTKETLLAATPESVTAAWHRMLRESKMLVTVVGSTDPEAACAALRRRLEGVERAYQPMPTPHFVARCEQVKDVRESEKIRQGKLVLGFRVDMRPSDPLAPAMRSFCDVFGGGPYSKLFMNVREKMSLCYYCSARFVRQNSYIFIQCGCEEENMDKAVAEILHQLEMIRDGDCKAELESSRIAMIDALDGVADTPNGLENWYAARLLDDVFRTPAQVAEETRSVTVEQLQECAGRLSLDTVYRLVAEKEEVQAQ